MALKSLQNLLIWDRACGICEKRAIDLEQAAQRTPCTIHPVENRNGQMSPTYDALKKLAVGLDISVPQLFTLPVKDQINGRMVITKNGQGTAHATATYEHELWQMV